MFLSSSNQWINCLSYLKDGGIINFNGLNFTSHLDIYINN